MKRAIKGEVMRIWVFVCLYLLANMIVTATWAESSKIPIYVTPFYNSQGPEVNVGKYSEGLKTSDAGKLEGTITKMLREKDTLTPEQMFVASVRLYDLGKKDEAVYWFYEAEYRARLFVAALSQPGTIGNKGFELKHAYGAFMQLAGTEINGYAGCDPDKWLGVLKKVKNTNLRSPNLQQIFPGVAFVEKEKWDTLNNQVSSGMDGLSRFIEQSKPTWKQKRAANNADEKYCK
jgi:hypothetical protein